MKPFTFSLGLLILVSFFSCDKKTVTSEANTTIEVYLNTIGSDQIDDLEFTIGALKTAPNVLSQNVIFDCEDVLYSYTENGIESIFICSLNRDEDILNTVTQSIGLLLKDVHVTFEGQSFPLKVENREVTDMNGFSKSMFIPNYTKIVFTLDLASQVYINPTSETYVLYSEFAVEKM